MKRLLLTFLALGVLGIGLGSARAQFFKKKEGDGPKTGWLGSYAQGKEEARRTGKPLMVVIRCQP